MTTPESERDPRIDELARELAGAINRVDPSGRGAIRDHAIDLLKAAVEAGTRADAEGEPAPPPPPSGSGALNPFALGIPLLLLGLVLTALFPPVGLVLLLLGVAACAIGLTLALAGSAAARWRARGGAP